MNSSSSAETTHALKTDLHGETLGTNAGVFCDFCGGPIDVRRPVLYEALHITDLSNIQRLMEPPDMWMLDGARCEACAIETIEPATDGVAEALVRLPIAEANGIFSADTRGLDLVSHVPGDVGYHPPRVALDVLVEDLDFGLLRWHRLRILLEVAASKDVTPSLLFECIEQSRDIPPSVAELCP